LHEHSTSLTCLYDYTSFAGCESFWSVVQTALSRAQWQLHDTLFHEHSTYLTGQHLISLFNRLGVIVLLCLVFPPLTSPPLVPFTAHNQYLSRHSSETPPISLMSLRAPYRSFSHVQHDSIHMFNLLNLRGAWGLPSAPVTHGDLPSSLVGAARPSADRTAMSGVCTHKVESPHG
jgi:hypothetical protein